MTARDRSYDLHLAHDHQSNGWQGVATHAFGEVYNERQKSRTHELVDANVLFVLPG